MSVKLQGLTAARAVKSKAQQVFKRFGYVSGVGITEHNGHYAVQVNLTEEPSQDWPTEIDGVHIVVQVVGKIRKHA